MCRLDRRRWDLAGLVAACVLAGVGSGCLLATEREPHDESDLCTYRDRTYRIPEPPPDALVTDVRTCEADAEDCTTLCTRLLHETDPTAEVASCYVEHDPQLGHDVLLGYYLSPAARGCPAD